MRSDGSNNLLYHPVSPLAMIEQERANTATATQSTAQVSTQNNQANKQTEPQATQQEKQNLEQLKQELAKTEQELANAQTAQNDIRRDMLIEHEEGYVALRGKEREEYDAKMIPISHQIDSLSH